MYSKIFILFWLILGQGLKLGPINFIDELALTVLIYYYYKKNGFKIKYNITFLFGIYFILLNLIGFLLYLEFSALRLIYVGVLITLSSNIKITFLNKEKQFILLAYPIFIVIINLFEIINIGKIVRYSHQNWLWSGTAYSSLGTIVCFSLYTVKYKDDIKKIFLSFLLCSLAGILTDSRTTILLISLQFFFYLIYYFILNHKIFILKKIRAIIFTITLFLTIFTTLNKIVPDSDGQFLSAYNVGKAILTNKVEDNSESDSGRKLQTEVSFKSIINSDLFHLFFGYGGEAHKTYLLKYFEGDKLSGGDKVRPVGISTIIIDGGFLFLLLYIYIIFINLSRIVINLIYYNSDIYI